MAKWQYTNTVEGGGSQTITLTGLQYQTVSDVQTYATAQGHTIEGGVTPPNSSLFLLERDNPLELLSVGSDGNLVISGQAGAASGNAANSVYILPQATGSTLYPGKGMKIGVSSSNQLEAQDLGTDDRPTIWANGAHTSGNEGEYVFRGQIDAVVEMYASGSNQYLRPLANGTHTLYWDIENKRLTAENAGWPACGGFNYSGMSYILPQTTTDIGWASGNIVIDSVSEVNNIRNKTSVTPASGGTFRHVTLNDPSGVNSHDTIWQTGDKFAVVLVGGSSYGASFGVTGSAQLLDPDGDAYSSLLILAASNNDQSVLFEVVNDAGTQKWQVTHLNSNTIQSTVNVDYHIMQESLTKTPVLKRSGTDTWHKIQINSSGVLQTTDLDGSNTKTYSTS